MAVAAQVLAGVATAACRRRGLRMTAAALHHAPRRRAGAAHRPPAGLTVKTALAAAATAMAQQLPTGGATAAPMAGAGSPTALQPLLLRWRQSCVIARRCLLARLAVSTSRPSSWLR